MCVHMRASCGHILTEILVMTREGGTSNWRRKRRREGEYIKRLDWNLQYV